MLAGEFSDEDFFRTLAASGARVLLIGRRALILLGAPVMTADYDVWIHFDDIEKLNASFEKLDHMPSRSPADARGTGRYVLENGERIDVMVARSKSSPEGSALEFDAAWSRRQKVTALPGVEIYLPSIDDLIATKIWGSRPKDELPLPADEFERRREAVDAVNGPEGVEIRDLIAWFLRRYPTPLDRLRYSRRKYDEATRFRGVASSPRR
jgi:hypothetical protein